MHTNTHTNTYTRSHTDTHLRHTPAISLTCIEMRTHAHGPVVDFWAAFSFVLQINNPVLLTQIESARSETGVKSVRKKER